MRLFDPSRFLIWVGPGREGHRVVQVLCRDHPDTPAVFTLVWGTPATTADLDRACGDHWDEHHGEDL